MKVLVVGTGAIGGLYGGKLSQGGAHVSVVARSDYDAVLRSGYEIESVWGDFQFMPERVFQSLAACKGQDFDLIVVATKALPEHHLWSDLKSVFSNPSAILILQNGIFVESAYCEAFPDVEILSGLAFVCAYKKGPAHVQHVDYGRLTLGHFSGPKSAILTQLLEIFEAAEVPTQGVEAIQKYRWIKLIWNAAFNPLSVRQGGMTTQAILADSILENRCRLIMNEVLLLAHEDGYELASDLVEKNIRDTRLMKPYKTSMLLDFERGHPLEIEAILGNAIRFAALKNVPVPNIKELYDEVTQISRLRR